MFIYPQWTTFETMFELEDLEADKFVVVCKREKPNEMLSEKELEDIENNKNVAFIWQGEDFEQIGSGKDTIRCDDFVK